MSEGATAVVEPVEAPKPSSILSQLWLEQIHSVLRNGLYTEWICNSIPLYACFGVGKSHICETVAGERELLGKYRTSGNFYRAIKESMWRVDM